MTCSGSPRPCSTTGSGSSIRRSRSSANISATRTAERNIRGRGAHKRVNPANRSWRGSMFLWPKPLEHVLLIADSAGLASPNLASATIIGGESVDKPVGHAFLGDSRRFALQPDGEKDPPHRE